MTNVNFNLRNPKGNSPQSIWAVFYVSGDRTKINTNQTILPKDWSRSNQKALSGYIHSGLLNKLLKEQTDFISDYIELKKLKKQRFNKEDLKIDFNNHFKIGEPTARRDGDATDFISFIDKCIESRPDLSKGAIADLRIAKNHIMYAFDLLPQKLRDQWDRMSSAEKELNPDFLQPTRIIDFDDIGQAWMQKFHNYFLKTTYTVKRKGVSVQEKYSKNYVSKMVSKAKMFCRLAGGRIKDISFNNVSSAGEDSDTIYLSWEEIGKLKELDLDPNSLHGKVRNLFVFNCYLGLRYSDLYKLDHNRFEEIKGQFGLKIRLQKTDELVHFPVLPSAQEILKIYNYKLPVVDDEDFNREIKEIAKAAGIIKMEHKRITKGGVKMILKLYKYEMIASHTARRSFATNFENDGVPSRQLMLVTGHTSEHSFRKYVKSKPENHFTEFISIGVNR